MMRRIAHRFTARLLQALACILLMPLSSQAWFDCNWLFRTEVVVQETSGALLNNQQVLVTLSAANVDSNYTWSTNGDDIRVLDSDDSTPLNFFIENWNQAGQSARLWVLIPTLSANESRQVLVYYGNNAAANAENLVDQVFVEPGIRFHTRNSGVDPFNRNSAFNAFNNATDNVAGYGCTFVTDFTNINNQNQFGPPNQNSSIVALSESYFEVAAGEAGVWSFRYGADFGLGGGLYVDGVALEEQWNDDLWWAGNWNAANEILEGSISLGVGFHKLEVIGGEGCCDGGITVQYRRPGGNYQTFQTNTINIGSRSCAAGEPSLTYAVTDTSQPLIEVAKRNIILNDPINGTSSPKWIPGGRVQYLVDVSNRGRGSGDNNSYFVVDEIPANTSLYLQGASPFSFVDGTPPSNLSFNYVAPGDPGDDVAFSNDGGLTFNYTPVTAADGTDPAVTHVRLSFGGQMSCGTDASPSTFTVGFEIVIN